MLKIESNDEYATVYEESLDDELLLAEDTDRQADNRQWKHTLTSKMAYLLGVPQNYFSEGEPFEAEIYKELEQSKPARIIRNLCALRTSILKNNSRIHAAFMNDLKNLSTLPEYIPVESLRQLAEDGISIEKPNYRLNSYTIDINDHIRNRINNVKQLLPSWINWDYVKELFVMPNGTKEQGVIVESKHYAANRSKYPFQVYINWPDTDGGNILYHDGKFAVRLYDKHNDRFSDMTKVRDASEKTKISIYDFLKDSNRTSIIVDCENSDPYKLCAVLRNLDQEKLTSKIVSIVLIDDCHTTDAWKILKDYTDIPVIYKQIDRVKDTKSQVDQTLMITATKMVFSENIDSFVLAASDSDYWALMRELPDTRFLVMVEYSKCGPDIKAAMEEKGIFYCYMDDFCTGNINDIKDKVFLKELRHDVESILQVDLNQIIGNIITRTRMGLTDDEKNVYYKRLKKDIHTEVDDYGKLTLSI